MSEKQETVADIVAEMRSKAKHFEECSSLMVSESALALYLYPIADRLKAAWKRERERDTRLLFLMLWYEADDYYGQFATPRYKRTIKECCKRVGVPYRNRGMEIAEQMQIQKNTLCPDIFVGGAE